MADSDLRRLSGCTVVAIRRRNETDLSIRPDPVLLEGDVAVLLGPEAKIQEASYLFCAPDVVAPEVGQVDELPSLVELEAGHEQDLVSGDSA